METLLQDLRYAVRTLRKDAGFTITAVLTLGLCIGANTAIFTVLNAVILEPLPFSQPDRLVALHNVYPGVGVERGSNGVPDYLDRRRLTDVFDSVALVGGRGYDVGSQGSPSRIDGLYVTPSYFRVLCAKPLLGRAFTENDAVFQQDKFAILSFGLWKDMFAGDREILGKNIRLSGVLYRIVGVMPEGFVGLEPETRLWVPFALSPQQTSDDARHNNNWSMIARLKPGVTAGSAQQRIDALNRQNLERFPKYRKLLEQARFGTKVVGLKDEMVSDVRPTLSLLQAAVAFVLLIGCVNVANLMLVRSNIRMREHAIRFSLGASRWRLAGQLLAESIMLAGLGGLVGVLTGLAGVRALAYLGTNELPRGAGIQIDGSVLAFSAVVATLTGLVFGSVPVYHLFRRDLNAVSRQTGRSGTTGKPVLRTQSALVVCQVSLAFILLIGSALLTLSFVRLLWVNSGFQPQNVMTAAFSLPRSRYADDARARSFIAGLLDSVGAIPGVAHAGATSYLPFSGDNNSSMITIDGHALAPGENPPVPGWNVVDAGYFQTMGIPLLQGRTFAAGDTDAAPKAVVIDQFMARKYWPKGGAIGARIHRGLKSDDALCTVIGVVGSVKTGDLAEQSAVGQVYFDYRQFVPSSMYLVVKTGQDDPRLIAALRRALAGADPELPLFDAKSMPERVSLSVRNRRAAMIIILVFAGLALTLSAIGIYGVLAYAVTQRTREFGIRIALGAGAGDVIGMVAGQGIKLAAIGLAIGVGGALLLTRLMTTLLFGVEPNDPWVFGLVAAALMAVALAASLLPSVRAIRVRPAVALRQEY